MRLPLYNYSGGTAPDIEAHFEREGVEEVSQYATCPASIWSSNDPNVFRLAVNLILPKKEDAETYLTENNITPDETNINTYYASTEGFWPTTYNKYVQSQTGDKNIDAQPCCIPRWPSIQRSKRQRISRWKCFY